MKYVYPAVFREEDGKILVDVPDLSSIHTFGDNLVDVIDMTKDAIEMWLCMTEDRKGDIPKPSNLADIHCDDSQFVSLVVADTDEYRRLNDERAVRKNVTIPNWMSEQAAKANLNLSRVLQDALKERLSFQS